MRPLRPESDNPTMVEEDAIVCRRLGGRENWLAVLKECPVSPDDVPPRRRELPERRKL